jgi:hypothetical protein
MYAFWSHQTHATPVGFVAVRSAVVPASLQPHRTVRLLSTSWYFKQGFIYFAPAGWHPFARTVVIGHHVCPSEPPVRPSHGISMLRIESSHTHQPHSYVYARSGYVYIPQQRGECAPTKNVHLPRKCCTTTIACQLPRRHAVTVTVSCMVLQGPHTQQRHLRGCV